MTSDEQILVIPSFVVQDLGVPEGIATDVGYASDIIHHADLAYLPRSKVEDDPSYKQIIPYVAFLYNVQFHEPLEVLVYQRMKASGESRLHGDWSIGVGGHMNPMYEDPSHMLSHPGYTNYYRNLNREIQEELTFNGAWRSVQYGPVRAIINDNSNPVGRVHLGLVHFVTDVPAHIEPREPAIGKLRRLPLSFLLSKNCNMPFESWSQLCLQYLGEHDDLAARLARNVSPQS